MNFKTEVEPQFPNLYKEGNFVKGEINICAVYDGKKLINNPNQEDKERYKNTFVEDVFEIKIDLQNSKVYEIGNKLEKNIDNHFYPNDNSCCLGLFTASDKKSLLEFIRKYVCPFFVWHAYKIKYGFIPPWGEWAHGEKGIEQFKKEIKNTDRNGLCSCGSGKKYKICCMSNS